MPEHAEPDALSLTGLAVVLALTKLFYKNHRLSPAELESLFREASFVLEGILSGNAPAAQAAQQLINDMATNIAKGGRFVPGADQIGLGTPLSR
jgi:hypothetical protein